MNEADPHENQIKATKTRVAFVIHHPAPYTTSTLQMVQQRGVVDLQVISLLGEDRGHSFGESESPGYPLSFLHRSSPWGGRKNTLISSVLAPLTCNRYDVIMTPGIASSASKAIVLCSMALGRCFVYCADSIARPYGNPFRERIRALRDNLLMKFAGAVLVPGKASRSYFEDRGVPAARIFEGLYNLDPVTVSEAFNKALTGRASLRAQHGIPTSHFVFLMVANLTTNRCHDVLLDAFRIVSKRVDASLVLIGTGPKRSAIEESCRLGDLRNVKLIGSVHFRALPSWYAAADAYVHSGYEPYSTALQFGSIVGLPIVTTFGVGAAEDYLQPFKPELLSPVNQSECLAENMLRVATNLEFSTRLRQHVARLASQRSANWAAEQFERAATTALRHRVRPRFSYLSTTGKRVC